MRVICIGFVLVAFSLASVAAYLKMASAGESGPVHACIEVAPPSVHVDSGTGTVQKTLVVRNTSSMPVRLIGGRFGCTSWGCILCETNFPVEVPANGQCELVVSIHPTASEPGEFTLDIYTSVPDCMVVTVRISAGDS
jgi:hypothetical protein